MLDRVRFPATGNLGVCLVFVTSHWSSGGNIKKRPDTAGARVEGPLSRAEFANALSQFRTKFAEVRSFGDKRAKRDRMAPSRQRAVRSFFRKARRYWAFSDPAGAGETVRIGVNGGGLVRAGS